MYLAKVIGKVVSIVKHNAYQGRKLLLVQLIDPHTLELADRSAIAVDYVGAGEGDIVLVGAAPGVAREVFNLDCAPIRELIVGIVDRIDTERG